MSSLISVHAPAQRGDAHGSHFAGQRHPGSGLLAALLPRRTLRR